MDTVSSPETVSKVWVVLFLDGNGGVAYLTTFSYDSDMKAIEQWAEAKIATDKETFSFDPYTKSLAQRHVIYGSDVDRLHITRPLRAHSV